MKSKKGDEIRLIEGADGRKRVEGYRRSIELYEEEWKKFLGVKG